MADDLLLTPEEQDERARQWLRDNGLAVAVGIGLGLAGIFGYNQYQAHQQTQAEQASSLYSEVIELANDSALTEATEQIDQLKSDYSATPYASKVALLKAKQLADTDQQAAVDELQWVIENSREPGVQHVARIRQAKLKLAMNDIEAARRLANYVPAQGFESYYQELLGDIEVKSNNSELARTHYDKAIESLGETQTGYTSILTMKKDRLPSPSVVGAAATDKKQPSENTQVAESEN